MVTTLAVLLATARVTIASAPIIRLATETRISHKVFCPYRLLGIEKIVLARDRTSSYAVWNFELILSERQHSTPQWNGQ